MVLLERLFEYVHDLLDKLRLADRHGCHSSYASASVISMKISLPIFPRYLFAHARKRFCQPYFFRITRSAASASLPSMIRAVARTCGPSGLPVALLGPTSTAGLLRMRLILP